MCSAISASLQLSNFTFSSSLICVETFQMAKIEIIWKYFFCIYFYIIMKMNHAFDNGVKTANYAAIY